MPAYPRHPGELGFTLLSIAGALLLGREALRISGLSGPSSPGFGPVAMVAVVLAGLAIELARTLLDRRTEPEPFAARLRRLGGAVLPPPVAAAIPLLLLYLVGLELVGFVPASFLFLTIAVALLLRGRPLRARLLLAGTVAAGTVLLVRFLFQELFQVLLP